MAEDYVAIVGKVCISRTPSQGERPPVESFVYLGEDLSLYSLQLAPLPYDQVRRVEIRQFNLGDEVSIGEGKDVKRIADQAKASGLILNSFSLDFDGETLSGQRITRKSTSTNGLADLVEEIFKDPS